MSGRIVAAPSEEPEPFRFDELWPQTRALATLEDLIERHAAELADNGGDLEAIPEIAELLAFDETDFLAHLERLALKALALKADSEAVKMERVRLQVKESRWAKGFESLKGWIARQMHGRKIGKHKTAVVGLSLVKNAQYSARAASEATLEDLYNSGSEFVERSYVFTLKREDAIAAHIKDEQDRGAARELLIAQGEIDRIRAEIAGQDGAAEMSAAEIEWTVADVVAKRVDATFTPRLPAGVVVERGFHVRIT